MSYRWGLIEWSSDEGEGHDIVGYKYLKSRRPAQCYNQALWVFLREREGKEGRERTRKVNTKRA